MNQTVNKNLTCIALIPARSGSERIPNKNIKPLAGHPLIAYSIASAQASNIFRRIIVSTDSREIAKIAARYGAEVPFLRPPQFATATSPDIEWVRYVLETLVEQHEQADCFAILRPTNPFRQPETIRRAWARFLQLPHIDSLRAVELCRQHPAKMWKVSGTTMEPLIPEVDEQGTPLHSKQYKSLPNVYVQNASLEIARFNVPLEKSTISGEIIAPFFTEGYEGFDINTMEDWVVAEYLLRERLVQVPRIQQ